MKQSKKVKKQVRVLFFSMFWFLICQSACFAKVLTVNNAGNGAAQYTSVSTAISAAATGDTLYLSPSSSNYGSFTITKPITIIGLGTHADVQLPYSAIVANINIQDSLFSVNIMGISANAIYFGQNNNLISIIRCRINYWILLNNYVTNSIILNCICVGTPGGAGSIMGCNYTNTTSFSGISNVTIQGNILSRINSLQGMIIIQNNVFLGEGGYAFFNSPSPVSATIQNNIFYEANPAVNTSGCVFHNNITYINGSSFSPLGGTNFDNTNPLFMNVPIGNTLFDYSYNYNLQAGSPGKNAGTDGTDIGAYGSNSPLSTTGEPLGVPVIRKMEVQNFNAPQNGNVNVKVRSTKAR